MALPDRLRPENNSLDKCIKCPTRGNTSRWSARLALGLGYMACEPGPILVSETVRVMKLPDDMQADQIWGLSIVKMTEVITEVICGKMDIPTDLATRTIYVNGEISRVCNIQTNETIWYRPDDF